MGSDAVEPEFSIEREELDAALLLRVTGELDLRNADSFIETARSVSTDSPPVLGVHLGAVTFIDSTGIRSLVQVADDLKASGRGMRIVAPSRIVTRALQVTGIDERLDIDQDVDAFAAQSGP